MALPSSEAFLLHQAWPPSFAIRHFNFLFLYSVRFDELSPGKATLLERRRDGFATCCSFSYGFFIKRHLWKPATLPCRKIAFPVTCRGLLCSAVVPLFFFPLFCVEIIALTFRKFPLFPQGNEALFVLRRWLVPFFATCTPDDHGQQLQPFFFFRGRSPGPVRFCTSPPHFPPDVTTGLLTSKPSFDHGGL